MTGRFEFKAKTEYGRAQDRKANTNLPQMAVVGRGDGTTFQTGRTDFYWIRLINDANRLTQVFCDVCALSYGDRIYVARAKDRNLSYYEFISFIQDAAGVPVPPICPKFAQVVYVSMGGCHYTTLGAAITFITGLAAGPAANRLFLIKVQAGNYAEAVLADLTIPRYVTVEGCGEATEIELGGFSLIMGNDTSLTDAVVESSDPAEAIRISGVSNVLIRDVRCIQAATASCYHVFNASYNVELRDCIAEVPSQGIGFRVSGATTKAALHTCTAVPLAAHNAATYGFQVGGTSTVRMDYCRAEDNTYKFGIGLVLDDASCFCFSRWCTFRATTADVQTGDKSTWYHLACHWDPQTTLAGNTIAGTHVALPTKRFNQTVIVAEEGGDFQLLSEAIEWIGDQGDAANDKRYGVLILHGNFAEAGNVTIPQHVHVEGQGEGSVIGMGANDLYFSSNSSAHHVRVDLTDSASIHLNGVTNTIVNDVHCVTSSSQAAFMVYGASTSVTLIDCLAELNALTFGFLIQQTAKPKLLRCRVIATTGNCHGFVTNGETDVVMEHCIADDTTYLKYALDMSSAADCTVTTRHCILRAATKDVITQAGSTWRDFASHYDAGNITVNGTFVPLPQSPVNLDGRADALIFDADGDTTKYASADDDIVTKVGNVVCGHELLRVHQWDEVYDAGTWYDHQLQDATDGDHFRQNAATYPTGWTEVDAAAGTNTTNKFSFWYLYGQSTETSWKYRKQMNMTIGAGDWVSFAWGPILWRDGGYTADLHYYFGLYSDNGAGAIDEDIYIRVHLWWDSANTLWKIRGEEGDGSAGNEFTNPDHTGAWQTFYFPIHQPIWVRSLVRNVAAQTCRAYIGTAPWPPTHTLLLDQAPTVTNWNTVNGLWLQTHMTRGAGVIDYLYIGAVDYEDAT